METLDEVLSFWERDAKIDQVEPGREIINIPMLHTKYLKILTHHRIASKKANFDFMTLKKVKWEYYTGKLPQEELVARGWEPFRYVLKSDISIYLEGDADLIKLLQKKIYHD